MKKEKTKELQVNLRNKKLFYLVRFSIALFVSLFILFKIYSLYSFNILQVYEAQILSHIVRSNVIGNTLEIKNAKLYVTITKECIGMKTLFFLLALFISTPRLALKRKIILILISPLIAFIINMGRIYVAIILSILTNAKFYSFYDHYLLALGNSIIILLLWYFLAIKHITPLKKGESAL